MFWSRSVERSARVERSRALTWGVAPLLALVIASIGCQSKEQPPGLANANAAPPAPAAPAPKAEAQAAIADPADWCGGHALPESKCTKCNPELVEKFKAAGDWCAAHGFPESACPQCNPMKPPVKKAAQAAGAVADPADWCGGHAIPESKCTKCNPELVEKFKAAGDWCAVHGFPESACPQCNPMKPPVKKADAQGATADPADWCGGHAIPESKCTKCNPELVEKFKAAGDWCAAHGFPESACPQCNPMKPPVRKGDEQGAADWCPEHGLPESKCSKCNTSLAAQFEAAGDWCGEHGFPESVCPRCNPMKPPAGFSPPPLIPEGTQVRLARPEIASMAGIEVVPAAQASLAATIEAPARLAFDENRTAEVGAPAGGVVREIRIDLGDRVEAGQTLVVLASARAGDLQGQLRVAQERLRAAKTNLARERELVEARVTSRRDFDEAQREQATAAAEVESLRGALKVTGAGGGGGEIEIKAPIPGVVVERDARVGRFVPEATSLVTVSDTRRLWAYLDIAEADIGAVHTDQAVELRLDALPGRTFDGRITWIGAAVDPRTRTVRARAEIANEDDVLRAHQFGRARIEIGAPDWDVVVPMDAVQRVGTGHVVFVRTEQGVYEPREVRLGRGQDRWVQLAGDAVAIGEAVVTTGAFLLKTELSRDAIGAGCCEVEAPGGG